jgi:mevalonate kinase
MPAFTATAPGKIILFGEHAVVYERPAIAVPVSKVKARVVVTANPEVETGEVFLQAPDIGLETSLATLPPEHPLAKTVSLLLSHLNISRLPACTVRITSTIPVASGLGSGTAVSVAMLRSLSAFLGHPLPDEGISSLAFEVEKMYHGTPSGIDNTSIAFSRPVYFIKGQPIQFLSVLHPFTIVIGDTGIASSTSTIVGDVRRLWQADPKRYEAIFDSIGQIASSARRLIEKGQADQLGPLMDQNHSLLQELGVSCPELDHLITIVRHAGALGAKLSGGGRGGNMIALTRPEDAPNIQQALLHAGAIQTIETEIR